MLQFRILARRTQTLGTDLSSDMIDEDVITEYSTDMRIGFLDLHLDSIYSYTQILDFDHALDPYECLLSIPEIHYRLHDE